MFDGKMVGLIVGDTGAFCHYCKHTRQSAHDINNILQGFKIDKTMSECMATWKSLEEGDILYDDPARHGQVHKPLTETPVNFFSITHMKMRSLDNVLKIYYRLISGQHIWTDCQKPECSWLYS